MARAVHFEIHASDPQALMRFYGDLFGWTFNKWQGGDYWEIHTGPDGQPGIDGGLVPRRGPVADAHTGINAFVVTIDVENLDQVLARASHAKRASVAQPKMAVPGIGWLAYLRDPDGNMVGLMQRDPLAK
jgi:hypothetical protein